MTDVLIDETRRSGSPCAAPVSSFGPMIQSPPLRSIRWQTSLVAYTGQLEEDKR